MDKGGDRISIMYLQFFDPISNGKKYSWGSAALSRLYRQLCKALEKTAKQIGGALLLVQLWAWARFPHICPVMRHPQQALPPGPRIEHSMHVLRAYRVSLTSLRPNRVSCLTSGNRFGMFFWYLQFTFKGINIFYFRVTCIVHICYTFFLIILLIWLFASVGSLQIVWELYTNYLGSLPAYCTAGQHIWRSIVPLIHFWVVEDHISNVFSDSLG